jgi:hypothetical protein
MRQNDSPNLALRQLPAVERVLQVSSIRKLSAVLTGCVRRAVAALREQLKKKSARPR